MQILIIGVEWKITRQIIGTSARRRVAHAAQSEVSF